MRKLISILLTFSLIFSLTACGNDGGIAPDIKDEPVSFTYPYNIVNRPMKAGDVYDYQSVCYSDRSLTTDGHVYIYDYLVEPSGDGMVDKTVKVMFIFDDDNAWNYGMSFDVLYADFVHDQVIDADGDWTVTVDGTDYTVEVLQDEFISGGWTPMSNYVSKYVLTIRMPESYDDVGLFFYNSQNKLDVAGEDAPIPDGTPVEQLIDADSQWFILGGKGADWEETKTPTYYGETIEAQVNNVAIEDVLGGTPVFDVAEEDYGDEAPPPLPEDNEEIIVDEGFTYVEFDDWSHGSFKRESINEMKLRFTCYNTTPGSYVKAKYWIDDIDNPVAEKTLEGMYNEDSQMYPYSLIFMIDGTGTTAPSVGFKLELYDADGNCVSVTQLDIPFEEETPSADETVTEGVPKFIIREISVGEIDSSLDRQNVDFIYEIENFQEPMSVGYYVSDGEGGDPVDFFTLFNTTATGTISVPVPASDLLNDELYCRFRLLDAYDEQIEEVSFIIPVK